MFNLNSSSENSHELVSIMQEQHLLALSKINFDAVENDIKQLLNSSQTFWPSDYGNV
jgi:catalase (peroxidase I)